MTTGSGPGSARGGGKSRLLRRLGLLVLTCGTYGNVLRLLPPLVIDADLRWRAGHPRRGGRRSAGMTGLAAGSGRPADPTRPVAESGRVDQSERTGAVGAIDRALLGELTARETARFAAAHPRCAAVPSGPAGQCRRACR